MLFDTPVYFFFLTLVVLIYWRLAWRQQNLFLVAVSYLFYGWWDWRFLGLIWISTIVDYYCALWVARSTDPRLRKTWLAVSVVLNLAFLGTFKYFNFFSTSLSALLNSLGLPVSTATLDILLPPGISFYTFQALAYITDVYFRKLEPSKNLVDYALFISFFPHLIAGPINGHHWSFLVWKCWLAALTPHQEAKTFETINTSNANFRNRHLAMRWIDRYY